MAEHYIAMKNVTQNTLNKHTKSESNSHQLDIPSHRSPQIACFLAAAAGSLTLHVTKDIWKGIQLLEAS